MKFCVQHTTSPAAVERKLLSISPTSPDDELELVHCPLMPMIRLMILLLIVALHIYQQASTNQERRLFDDSYGTLPVESTHSTMSLVSR